LKDIIKNVVDNVELFQTEKDTLEKDIKRLEGTIQLLTNAITDSDHKVSVLVGYMTAVELLQQGLPKGIIGERIKV
jgi:septal ring factor EnvC (AmiA/AmiB activator)